MQGLQHQKILKTLVHQRWQLSFLFQRATGKPVGWMYPSFHASSKHTNSTIDKAMRSVSARAMERLCCASCLASLLRSMKNPALAKQAKMPKKRSAIAYVMQAIMKACL